MQPRIGPRLRAAAPFLCRRASWGRDYVLPRISTCRLGWLMSHGEKKSPESCCSKPLNLFQIIFKKLLSSFI